MLGQQRAALALLVAAAAAVAVAAQGPSAQPPPPQPPPAHQAAESAEALGSSEAGSASGARPKRYVAALARNGDLPFSVRREWHKKLHPAMSAHRGLQAALQPGPNAFGIPGKRYVGALARGGALPGKRVNYAGDDFQGDDPVDWEMERLLREELQALEELQAAEQVLQRLQASEDKRSLASLARGGQLPGKRSASADKGMDAGPEAEEEEGEEEDEWKRGISTLAKNGQLPAPLTPGDNRSAEEEEQAAAAGAGAGQSKRGGVAALARLGYLPPHKKDLDWLLSSLQAPQPDKRYVGALARQYGLPPPGKRNLGSLARGGGLSALRYAGAKKSDLLDGEQQKRSATSRLQNGLAPLGKRVPAFWHVPQQYRAGKRFAGGEEGPEEWSLADAGPEEVAKRYVAALLRQGRLPVGGAGASYASPFSSFADGGADERDDAEPLDEEKRHIGALRRISRAADAQDEAETEAEGEVRAKRTASDELALPVLQPDEGDADDTAALLQRTLYVGEDAAPADKRFLGPPPAPFEDGAAPLAPRRQQPWADAAVAKRHIGALARLGWLPAFHAGTQGERYGRGGGGGRARFGKRDREDPADEPRAAARAAGERASGAAAFPQHLSAATHAIRRLLERRHELLQLQRYNRIHLPHVVRR